jgi:hypothetical protein
VSLPAFLDALFEHGQVQVGPLVPALDPDEVRMAGELLALVERDVRADFPGDAPKFSLDVALWGAERFYRAAQLTVFRDAGPELVAAALADDAPPAAPEERHYAVDLVWRFLPDLARLARTASREDPLVQALTVFGGRWPLSSVGVPNVVPVSLAGLVDHPCMLRAYVDRIIARGDESRLVDPRVKEAFRQAVGLHAQLAGPLDKMK